MILKNVTLVCCDDLYPQHSIQLMNEISYKISFYDTKFFTGQFSSIHQYNLFITQELYKHVTSEFVMIIQYDGFPINLDAWTDEFLKYDYIGAPWYIQPWPLDQTVGNGGFSIRSNKFLEETAKLEYDGKIPEDVFVCRVQDKKLKSHGIRFAPHDLAYKFSVEDMPYKGQFGFHGKNTIKLNKQLGIFK